VRLAVGSILIFMALAGRFASADHSPPTEAEVLAQLQIGPIWDKVEMDAVSLQQISEPLRRVALSTANFKHGTAFFVGIIDGNYVMATNAHVVANDIKDLLPGAIGKLTADPSGVCSTPHGYEMSLEQVRFGLQKKSFECQQLIGVWPSIELALFTIKVDAADSAFFDGLGVRFDFSGPPAPGMALATFGYGEFMNPDIALMKVAGPFCKTFSPKGEFRFMSDPDEHSSGPYQVWSFAIGCNIAWGDSGSAIVDASTGHAIGLLWTGHYPKSKSVEDPKYLDYIMADQTPEIWSQLSYGSPALKIREVLRTEVKSGKLNHLQRDSILMVIQGGGSEPL
jgi:hypothetical protein